MKSPVNTVWSLSADPVVLVKRHLPAAANQWAAELQLYNTAAITAHTLSVLSGSKTQNQFISLEKGTAIGDFVRRSYFWSTLVGQQNCWG